MFYLRLSFISYCFISKAAASASAAASSASTSAAASAIAATPKGATLILASRSKAKQNIRAKRSKSKYSPEESVDYEDNEQVNNPLEDVHKSETNWATDLLLAEGGLESDEEVEGIG